MSKFPDVSWLDFFRADARKCRVTDQQGWGRRTTVAERRLKQFSALLSDFSITTKR